MPERFPYGGQAVIEGVMMRGPRKVAIAVRKPNQEIVVKEIFSPPWNKRWPFLRLPVIRGAVSLIEALVLGTEALMFSANEASPEDAQLSKSEMSLTVIVAFILAMALFVVLPTLAVHYLREFVPQSIILNLLEGLVRIIILLGYIYAISRMTDVQRVLEYHGAEHQVIHTWEAGEPLKVEYAQKYSPLHPRCGTSFLLFVVVVSVFLFSFFGWPSLWQRIVVRLLLMPVVAGLSYEVLKLSGRFHQKSPVARLVAWPGLALQRLTTRKPDASQLEVAIRALEAAMD